MEEQDLTQYREGWGDALRWVLMELNLSDEDRDFIEDFLDA